MNIKKYTKNHLFSCLWSKAHFFVRILLYLLNFLSQLNKEKKWEIDQNPRKPLIYKGFVWPNPFLKVGKKWAESGQKWAFSEKSRPKSLPKFLEKSILANIFDQMANFSDQK
jgi:hypothetical protein